MFAIPKTPEHPEDVAARERLRAIVRGPLREAWGVWFDVLCRLGRDPGDGKDEYYDDVTCLISDLEECLTCGREDHPTYLRMIAHGDIVPMFGVDGCPVVQDGEQMYVNRGSVELIEAAVAELAQWPEHTPEWATVERRLRCRGNPLSLEPDELDYAVREAAKIRHGGSAP